MAKLLPNLEKTVHLDTYKDAEVVQLLVRREGTVRISGILKNNTDHAISVEIDFNLVDRDGSRLGSVTRRVNSAPPNGSTPFEFPAGNPDAAFALVRQLRTVD
jgi:hypothetical protein